MLVLSFFFIICTWEGSTGYYTWWSHSPSIISLSIKEDDIDSTFNSVAQIHCSFLYLPSYDLGHRGKKPQHFLSVVSFGSHTLNLFILHTEHWTTRCGSFHSQWLILWCQLFVAHLIRIWFLPAVSTRSFKLKAQWPKYLCTCSAQQVHLTGYKDDVPRIISLLMTIF